MNAWLNRRKAARAARRRNRAARDAHWAAIHPPSQLDQWDGADLPCHLIAARIEADDDLMTDWAPETLERLALLAPDWDNMTMEDRERMLAYLAEDVTRAEHDEHHRGIARAVWAAEQRAQRKHD